MKFLGILQARSSSSRLPGKVSKPILGKAMLLRQIDRLKRCQELDQLVVATSNHESDDTLVEMCERNAIAYYRGSLNNVLDRFYMTYKHFGATDIVRLTGDCPLADAKVIDHVINQHKGLGAAYTSNTIRPTYPDGLDVEVFKAESLEKAWNEATLASEKEHVTPYIVKHPELFSQHNVENSSDMSALRWTVDTPEDFEFVLRIYEALMSKRPNFTMDDVLELLKKHPELKDLNANSARNSGYVESLEKDMTAP